MHCWGSWRRRNCKAALWCFVLQLISSGKGDMNACCYGYCKKRGALLKEESSKRVAVLSPLLLISPSLRGYKHFGLVSHEKSFISVYSLLLNTRTGGREGEIGQMRWWADINCTLRFYSWINDGIKRAALFTSSFEIELNIWSLVCCKIPTVCIHDRYNINPCLRSTLKWGKILFGTRGSSLPPSLNENVRYHV